MFRGKNDDNLVSNDGFSKKTIATLGFFAILFFPVVFLWWFCHEKMFKTYRMRPRYPLTLSFLVSSLSLWFLIPHKGYIPGFMDDYEYEGISSTFDYISQADIGIFSVVWYILSRMWILGFIVSFVFIAASVFSSVRFIKKNPSHQQFSDEWTYRWEYRRTISEYFSRRAKIRKLKNGELFKKNVAPLGLGVDKDFRDTIVTRHDKDANKHTIVTGGTGSGKTMTTLSLIKNDILSGIPVVMNDFKRDGEVAVKLAEFAHEAGVPFYHFLDTPAEEYAVPYSDSPCSYNPFINAGNGTPDMLVGMREYDTSADVYKQKIMQLAQIIYKMLRVTDRKYLYFDGVNGKKPAIRFDKGEIYIWLDSLENVNILLYGYQETLKEKGMPADERTAKDVAAMRKPGTPFNTALDSVQGQLTTMTKSGYGEYFDMSHKNHKQIDIYELTKKPCVILFSLDGSGQKDFSKALGSLIFQDLANISTKRNRENIKTPQVHIYSDEWQVVPADAITDLIEKSRGAGMGMTLISQSLSQIESGVEYNGESLLNGLLDSASNFIVHAGSGQESAEKFSSVIGKGIVSKYSKRNSVDTRLFSINYFSKKDQDIHEEEVEDWIFPPENFVTLRGPGFEEVKTIVNKLTFGLLGGTKEKFSVGTAIVINKSPYGIKTNNVLARKFEAYIDNSIIETNSNAKDILGEKSKTLSKEEVEAVLIEEHDNTLEVPTYVDKEPTAHMRTERTQKTRRTQKTPERNENTENNESTERNGDKSSELRKKKAVKKVVKKANPLKDRKRTQRQQVNMDTTVDNENSGSNGNNGYDDLDLEDIMNQTRKTSSVSSFDEVENRKQTMLDRFK